MGLDHVRGNSPRVVRTSSLTPSRSSSCATNFDTAGCPTWRRRAAAENDPESTTRTNASIATSRSMLMLRRNKSLGVDKCHANIRRGYCLFPNRAESQDRGNRGSAAAKIRSTDRADEELLAGINLAPVRGRGAFGKCGFVPVPRLVRG